MIRSFNHRGLEAFFRDDDRRKLTPSRIERIRRALDRLDASQVAQDMNLPGYRFHAVKGVRAGIYAVAVSADSWLRFRLERGDAYEVDLEDNR